MNPDFPKTILAIVILMALASTAVAQEYSPEAFEVWKCFSRGVDPNQNTALFELTRRDSFSGPARVYAAGVMRLGWFTLVGLDRRWDWELYKKDSGTHFRFSIVIEPGGLGRYYDWKFADEDGLANARQIFECKMKNLNK